MLARAELCGIMALGITMDESLYKFPDSSVGQDFFLKNSLLLPVQKGQTVYIPSGYVTFITCFMLLERNAPGPNAFISQLPLAGKFANEVGLTSHVKHAIKKKQLPITQLWKRRRPRANCIKRAWIDSRRRWSRK